MFSILACKVKQNAPQCHTYLEIIYARYGPLAHWVFIFFALLTNVLVGSQLLLGGSAVVASLTGMNVYAAIFLIPLGVCVYVVLGGLRATFLCENLDDVRFSNAHVTDRRLFTYAHPHGHHSLFYVLRLRDECPNRLCIGHVSTPQASSVETPSDRKPRRFLSDHEE